MTNAHDATFRLLGMRGPDKTICPSEVARALATSTSTKAATVDWRSMMPTVHAAIDQLVANDEVTLSWKGQRLASRAGPYRIGLARGRRTI